MGTLHPVVPQHIIFLFFSHTSILTDPEELFHYFLSRVELAQGSRLGQRAGGRYVQCDSV